MVHGGQLQTFTCDGSEDVTGEKNWEELLVLIWEDVAQACRNMLSSDSPYNRRCFVRSFFAAADASIFVVKDACLSRPTEYSAGELSLLREEAYSLQNGQIQIQPKFIPIDRNLRFAISMYVRGRGGNSTLELGDGGWEAFKQSIQIRNRITHPKGSEELEISNAELKAVRTAFVWFTETLNGKLED